MGDKQGAIADYNLAINLNPLHALVYYDRGLVYIDLKDKVKAIADFELSAKLCSEQGRTGCYKDAQYQIDVLKTQKPTPK
jgi:regulator of sirC expression with transglutaminase-like and TPR domain